MAILEYGAETHPINEMSVTFSEVARFSQRGVYIGRRETWNVEGTLIGDLSALVTRIGTLDAAYRDQAGDLSLFEDDGITPIRQILNSTTLGGVKVISGPNYGFDNGANWVTHLPFSATFQADINDGSAPALLMFRESLQFTGGGPRDVMVEVLTGPPIRQRTALKTAYKATQSGAAIGLSSYVTPPAPRWPSAELRNQRSTGKEGPDVVGPSGQPNLINFRSRWAYQFESASPLTGDPNV